MKVTCLTLLKLKALLAGLLLRELMIHYLKCWGIEVNCACRGTTKLQGKTLFKHSRNKEKEYLTDGSYKCNACARWYFFVMTSLCKRFYYHFFFNLISVWYTHFTCKAFSVCVDRKFFNNGLSGFLVKNGLTLFE